MQATGLQCACAVGVTFSEVAVGAREEKWQQSIIRIPKRENRFRDDRTSGVFIHRLRARGSLEGTDEWHVALVAREVEVARDAGLVVPCCVNRHQGVPLWKGVR